MPFYSIAMLYTQYRQPLIETYFAGFPYRLCQIFLFVGASVGFLVGFLIRFFIIITSNYSQPQGVEVEGNPFLWKGTSPRPQWHPRFASSVFPSVSLQDPLNFYAKGDIPWEMLGCWLWNNDICTYDDWINTINRWNVLHASPFLTFPFYLLFLHLNEAG